MEIELSERQMNDLAYKTALMLAKIIKKEYEPTDMVTVAEGAKILHITPDRMRRIANKFTCSKLGEHKQGRLLISRKELEAYAAGKTA